jgi:hypothetical protein
MIRYVQTAWKLLVLLPENNIRLERDIDRAITSSAKLYMYM